MVPRAERRVCVCSLMGAAEIGGSKELPPLRVLRALLLEDVCTFVTGLSESEEVC